MDSPSLPEGSELEPRAGPLDEELRALGAEGVQSLLLEGGPTLAGGFLEADLVDKLLVFSAPRFDAWPLMWIALVPQLHVALRAATPKRAFLWGWLTGTVANTIGFSWMDGLLERFGHMSPLESLPIVALLVGYQGLAFAFFSWGVQLTQKVWSWFWVTSMAMTFMIN